MITVVSTDEQKTELLSGGISNDLVIEWQTEIVKNNNTTVYIDLMFDNSTERINRFKESKASLVAINYVAGTLRDLPHNFIRINGWPGFLSKPVIECVSINENSKSAAEKLFSAFNKKIMWMPDTPGFVSVRVIAMLINEAYYTLSENVSTKAEIDTAMKLGTNYPFGPFEWAKKIGLKNLYELLNKMTAVHPKYEPCSLLKAEALVQ